MVRPCATTIFPLRSRLADIRRLAKRATRGWKSMFPFRPRRAGKEGPSSANETATEQYGLYPVASLDERRWAALIDAACLLFAYGGFLALFGSMGGQFTVSKLSAAVYAATFAIVYLHYFSLFTRFGGTTPGMMFRGLQ